MSTKLLPRKEKAGNDTLSLKRQLIAKSASLSLSTQRIGKELDEISGLLSKIDPPASPLLNSLDLKAQDLATYFFAAYSDSLDLGRSLSIYKTVKKLVRYILLSDRYFETGNEKLYHLARSTLVQVKDSLDASLKHSISYSIRQFTPFWQFERTMSKRMVAGETFSVKEVTHHNLFKSSDASLIYAQVLEMELPNYDQAVATVIHYNQALQDIADDFADIEEDLNDKMPNVFLLATVSFITFSRLSKLEPSGARDAILGSAGASVVANIAQKYMDSIERIQLPPQYVFLKSLSRHYFNTIENSLDKRPFENIIIS